MKLTYDVSGKVVRIIYDIQGRTAFEKVKNALNILPNTIDPCDIAEMASDFCSVDQADLYRIEAHEQVGYDFSNRVWLTQCKTREYLGSWGDGLFEKALQGDTISLSGLSFNIIEIDKVNHTMIVQRTDSDSQILITRKIQHTISGYQIPYVKIEGL